MARTLHAFVGAIHVGDLSESNGLWSFAYHKTWLAAPSRYALAPGLPLQPEPIVDTGSDRPVQWYFDNLLPEEGVRTLLAKAVKVARSDAFGLLQAYGSESAGSLTLTSRKKVEHKKGLIELTNKNLSARIAKLPRVPLNADAPKRMSLAGAQHKLAIVAHEGRLYEPIGSTPSTHILKPDQSATLYPHSVINEYFTMRLAQALRLDTPKIARRYVPQPVYLIPRFDRKKNGRTVDRLHSIDACQLLNLDRQFKYDDARLERLSDIADRCSNKALTRVRLYEWLIFNILVGNSDAHLKNLSFLVDDRGIRIAPHYDLIATSVYDTLAVHAKGHWPGVGLIWKLPGCTTFKDVSCDAMISAAQTLKIAPETARRILHQQASQIVQRANALVEEIQQENQAMLEQDNSLGPTFAGEMRLVRAIVHVVIQDMASRIDSPSP